MRSLLINIAIPCLMIGTISLSTSASAQSNGRYVPTENSAAIMDKKTGLVWKRCQEGKQWSAGFCLGSGKKFTWDQANQLASGVWRLPTKDELLSIVEKSRIQWTTSGLWQFLKSGGELPTIDQEAFPDTEPKTFWSSSLEDSDPNDAWLVSFVNGYASYYGVDRSSTLYVRLVRSSP